MLFPQTWDFAFSVHPHVRGVNFTNLSTTNILMRFIPTCVGLMLELEGIEARLLVHPHVRGVN